MKTFFIVGSHHKMRNCMYYMVVALGRLRIPVLKREEAHTILTISRFHPNTNFGGTDLHHI